MDGLAEKPDDKTPKSLSDDIGWLHSTVSDAGSRENIQVSHDASLRDCEVLESEMTMSF